MVNSQGGESMNRRNLMISGVSASIISFLPTKALTQGGPGVYIGPAPLAESSPADLDLVRRRLASFFERVVALSNASPPPGTNASNGWFVKAMQEDAELNVAQRPIATTTIGGNGVGSIALNAMTALRAGFNHENHFASGLTYLPVAIDAFNAAMPAIKNIAVSAFEAYATSGATIKQLEQQVKTEIDNIGSTVAKSGMVLSGTHANGWISVDIRDRAQALINFIDAVKRAHDSAALDFFEILKAILLSFTKFSTSEHDPWLKAEWQIGFTGVCSSAAKLMRHPPE